MGYAFGLRGETLTGRRKELPVVIVVRCVIAGDNVRV